MHEVLIIPPPVWMPARYVCLRHRTARLLRELGIGPADGSKALVSALETRLGVSIGVEQHPFPMPGHFSYTVCDAEHIQFVVHSATSPEHQDHSLWHEVGHIVFGTTEPGTADTVASTHRTGNYGDLVERDAEFFARLITAWTSHDAASRLAAQTSEGSQRLARAFEDRITWA